MKAIWNNQIIAESDDTVVVEGNHYFPINSIHEEYFEESSLQTICPWKGTASYNTIVVNGSINQEAAWFYKNPKPAAQKIVGRIAFWKGVQIEE